MSRQQLINYIIDTNYISQLVKELENNRFEVFQALQEAVLDINYLAHSEQISQSLLTVLFKECQEDSFTAESVFNKLLNFYVKSDTNCQYLQTLVLMAMYFHDKIKIEGDMFTKYIIKQNSSECKRTLLFISEVLKKRVNQADVQNFAVQQINVQQASQVTILEPMLLIDQLIRISEKKSADREAKNKKDIEQNSTHSEIKDLAILCLFHLRLGFNKLQLKKFIPIQVNNLDCVEQICGYHRDLISDYLYLLLQSKVTFLYKREEKITNLINKLVSNYVLDIDISYGKVTFSSSEDSNPYLCEDDTNERMNITLKAAKLYEALVEIEKKIGGSSYIDREILKENPSLFQICQYVCITIYDELYGSDNYYNFLDKKQSVVFEFCITLSKLAYLNYLFTREIVFEFNEELYIKVKEHITNIIYAKDDINIFPKYIIKTLKNIEKRCSSAQKYSIIDFKLEGIPESEQSNIKKGDDCTIQVLEEEDKFTFLGCCAILEIVAHEQTDEVNCFHWFANYFSFAVYDPYLFHHCVAVVGAIAQRDLKVLLQHHKQIIAPLIEMFEVNLMEVKFAVADTFTTIYEDINYKQHSDIYPYLRDILFMCVECYKTKKFFESNTLITGEIQDLIKLVIEVDNIEIIIQDDISTIEKVFLDMFADQSQRALLIEKNHQICLTGILKIKQKLNLDCKYLQDELKNVAMELAYKMNKAGNTLTQDEKTFYYKFFTQQTANTLGSQEILDLIFLLVLPSAIADSSAKNCQLSFKTVVEGQKSQQQNDLLNLNHQEIQNEFDQIDSNGEYVSEEEDAGDNEQEALDAEEGQDEDEEEVEEEENDQFLYDANYKDQIFVLEALTFIAAFSKQSPDIFTNYKKFEIFNQLRVSLDNELVSQDCINNIMLTIQRVILNIEEYYIKEETKELKEKETSTIFEDGCIEIYQMIQMAIQRIYLPYIQDSDDYKMSLIQNVISIIKFLNPKTVKQLYSRLYQDFINLLFAVSRTKPILSAFVLNCFFFLFKQCPEKAKADVKLPFLMITSMLQSTYVFKNLQAYENFQMVNLHCQFTEMPEIVEATYFVIADTLQMSPDIFEYIHPPFFQLFAQEDALNESVISELACKFFTAVSRYCKQLLSPEQVSSVKEILKVVIGFHSSSEYQKFQEILTVAKVMVGIQLDSENKKQNRIEINKLVEALPNFQDEHGFPNVLWILDQVQKSNLVDFTVNQKTIIEQFKSQALLSASLQEEK